MSKTTRCGGRPRSWVVASTAASNASRTGDADCGHLLFPPSPQQLNEWQRRRNQASPSAAGTELS